MLTTNGFEVRPERSTLTIHSVPSDLELETDSAESAPSFSNIVSNSRHMVAVFDLIRQVADASCTVLIQGETGTGKELVARALHGASGRCDGPFVAVNCAAIPQTLLESELFGHEKGAFTSAVGQRKGRFEMANGGTILLDEIGDLPMPMQAKLLRVLQERSFERIGGTENIHVNVRVVSATNRCLRQLMETGDFREDLYYRLNVVKIDLPPLRERREDIPLLAEYFVARFAGDTVKTITPPALDVMLRYDWPGNVRELENAIECACVRSGKNAIRVEHLPPDLLNRTTPKHLHAIDLCRPLDEHVREAVAQIEHEYLCKALQETRGHIGQCARICGISRRSIVTKMATYRLDKRAFKPA